MTTHNSKACCEAPVAIAESYTPKGSYQTIGATKCYVTGPTTARKAIYFIYDIFGFTNPTIQGADILASCGAVEYLVVMPDLFDGKVADPAWFAETTEEKRQSIASFLGAIADPKPHVQRIGQVLDAAKQKYAGVERWGAIGYCWGGKLVSLTSGPNSHWSVAIESSPAKLDPEDGKKATIPFGILASKDEPADALKAKAEELKTPKMVHTFDTQVHGWMSARANLKEAEVKKEYERGYQLTLDFFAAHL